MAFYKQTSKNNKEQRIPSAVATPMSQNQGKSLVATLYVELWHYSVWTGSYWRIYVLHLINLRLTFSQRTQCPHNQCRTPLVKSLPTIVLSTMGTQQYPKSQEKNTFKWDVSWHYTFSRSSYTSVQWFSCYLCKDFVIGLRYRITHNNVLSI